MSYEWIYRIEQNYVLNVCEIKLLDRHFGTEIYLIGTDAGKYIVKVLPLYFDVNNEGLIADYLFGHGLKVARLLQNREGNYVVKTSEFQFTVQEYIEGETLSVNSAPEWFMERSADFLGKAVLLLRDYNQLPLRFGKEFFSAKTAIEKKQHYINEVLRAKEKGALGIVPIVITSYVFASPTCAEGAIDAEGLKKYIRAFTKHFSLSEYDIKAVPYVLYFWHCVCNYRPDELANIAESYQPIAKLIYRLLNWLYDHVEELSEALAIDLV